MRVYLFQDVPIVRPWVLVSTEHESVLSKRQNLIFSVVAGNI